jgi:DNA-binding CsgD family transcriptional regulator
MRTGHLPQNAAPSLNILPFEYPKRRTDASYDRALASQETQLREALAEVRALRRQQSEVMQLPGGGVVRALFVAREAAARRVATLTSRQREVMEMVLAGRLSKIIAWELGISLRTVENHRASVMLKTGSKSVAALARLAIAAAWNGIDSPSVQPFSRVASPF